MRDGISGWRAAGMKVEKPDGAVTIPSGSGGS
jgi:hypothetical protein